MQLLFYADGTLEDPSGDGLLTRQIRLATEDGPMMGIFAIVFLVLYWGAIIFFISKMRSASREASEERLAQPYGDETFEQDNTGRKMAETIATLFFAGIWVWFFYLQTVGSQNSDSTLGLGSDLPELSIEQELMGTAVELNDQTPKQIDEVTVLERASVESRNFTYHYRIDQANVDGAALRKFVLNNTVPRVCAGDMRGGMRDHGVSYTYSYSTEGLRDPIEIHVNEQTCLDIGP